MKSWKEYHVGHVVATLVAGPTSGGIRSSPVGKLKVTVGDGVVGDRHCGRRRLADVREYELLHNRLPKGIEIANHRQFSAVSEEDLESIAGKLGLDPPQISHGLLGENIVVRGIKNFTDLPRGTMFFFRDKNDKPRSAVLFGWGENYPCIDAAKSLEGVYPGNNIEKFFVKKAMHLRGIVGGVYCSGLVCPGDTITAMVPL